MREREANQKELPSSELNKPNFFRESISLMTGEEQETPEELQRKGQGSGRPSVCQKM